MSIDLKTILPNLDHSLDGAGFIFGAGASKEAGYPTMCDLTKEVVKKLSKIERSLLDEVFKSESLTFDEELALPNIEQISDLVIAHKIKSGDIRFSGLEDRLKQLIVEEIVSVKNPNLSHHITFFEALKRRSFGLPATIFIFTTNYDLLFEVAAARVGVIIDNGFSGAVERFFDPSQFDVYRGTISGKQFNPSNQLTVKLIKLHGSVSWLDDSSKFLERDPGIIELSHKRALILPHRKKVMDTLVSPYNTLFAYASKILGKKSKYIVSCGFSFGDEHINSQLLVPVLRENKCRLFVLGETETSGMAELKVFPSFRAAFSTHFYFDGKQESGTTNLWKFSEFVKLLNGGIV